MDLGPGTFQETNQHDVLMPNITKEGNYAQMFEATYQKATYMLSM
jgi:hypothetical protein